MLYRRDLVWAGVAAAIGFWLVEAAIHSWIFGEDRFLHSLLPSNLNEWWMRIFIAFLLISFGVFAERRNADMLRVEKERHDLQVRLGDSLTKVLSGYLIICARCKAIREGDRWIRLESYVTDHTGVQLSHGLCPTCAEIMSR
jgi:hypothetical protein